ncbi:hypothetical protein GCM10028805_09180 [Spirosoma harenae]
MVTTLDKRATSGSDTQTGTTTVTYTYDTDGYVTAMNSLEKRTAVFNNKTKNEQVSITSSYSYTNGRLASVSTKNIGAYGVNTATIETYNYDSAGDLVTKTARSTYTYDPAVATEIPDSPTGPLRIWTYQKKQLMDYVEKSGASEVRPIALQNGLMTKLTIPGGYEATYTYDTDRHLTKTDEYINNTLNRTFAQTWSNAQPSSTALPAFKGWPIVNSEYGQPGVLVTANAFYLNTTTGKMEPYSEQTASNQVNSQGLVTNNAITVKYPNPASASQSYTTTETYTYMNCQ